MSHTISLMFNTDFVKIHTGEFILFTDIVFVLNSTYTRWIQTISSENIIRNGAVVNAVALADSRGGVLQMQIILADVFKQRVLVEDTIPNVLVVVFQYGGFD